MKDSHILHLLCKYLLRGQVTLGERACGQILTLNDYPSSEATCAHTQIKLDKDEIYISDKIFDSLI